MDEKSNDYNLILVIINWLIKIIYYKLVKFTINSLGLVNVIINKMIRHYDILNSIIINKNLFFILKFWLLLCYFLALNKSFLLLFIFK